jgi:hypothetical protein
MHVKLTQPSLAGPGTTLVIPLDQGEMIPELPSGGLNGSSAVDAVPRARVIKENDWTVPGTGDNTYAFVRSSTHRNLFRITLP